MVELLIEKGADNHLRDPKVSQYELFVNKFKNSMGHVFLFGYVIKLLRSCVDVVVLTNYILPLL